MFGKEHLFNKKSIKKTIFYILGILIKIGIVWERSLLIIKGIKKTIFYTFIINKNQECLGKNFYLSYKV
jgi:ABC-type uncharacterized transport system permease subunit